MFGFDFLNVNRRKCAIISRSVTTSDSSAQDDPVSRYSINEITNGTLE
jgi:hypothetical protein